MTPPEHSFDGDDSAPPTNAVPPGTPSPTSGTMPTRALDAPPSPFELGAGTRLPDKFGSYALREQLGEGGMGVVYKAWDEHLDRPAAIKILSPLIRAMPGAVERLKAEARAAARLNHPAIVQIYAYGEDAGWSWIAMEFVEGRDLSRILRAEGAMEPRRALRYMRQCAEGLDFAAREKIVHRDIKPANILITTRDDARVMDFGLAKRLDMEKGLTATGSTLGTPDYMSPEQALARPLDHRSDIYSLGCTLFALLSGRPPFGGGSAMEVMMRHVQDPLPIPDAWKSFAGGRMVRLIERMTHKEVDKRFQSWTDVLVEMKAVEDIMAKSPLAPAPLSLPPLIGGAPPTAAGARGNGRKRVLVAGGVALAVAAVAGIAAIFLAGNDRPPRPREFAALPPLPTPQSTPMPTATPPPPRTDPSSAVPVPADGTFASPHMARLAAMLSAGQWDAAIAAIQAMDEREFGITRIPAATLREEVVDAIELARAFETAYLPTTGTPVGDPLQRTRDILGDVERRKTMTLDQAWNAVLYLVLRRDARALDFAVTLGGNLGAAGGTGIQGPGPEIGRRMYKLFAMGLFLQPDRAEEWARIGPPNGQRPPAAPNIPGGGSRRPMQRQP